MQEQEPQQPPAPPAESTHPPRAEVRWETGGEAIHPALDFDITRRVAFVTVPLTLAQARGGTSGTRVSPYLIAVGPGFKNCLALELTGLELTTQPVFIQDRSRWPQARLKAFLENREPAPEIDDVYDRLTGLFDKYIQFCDPTEHKVCALWVMMSYVHPIFPALSYLKLSGPAGAGKSKLCTLIAHTAFNAVYASSLTPAAVFRIVHGSRATLVGDEMEGLARNPQMTTLLNAGYKRGSFVVRAGAKGQLASFDSFSPKVLASIENVSDTLASRTIVIRLAPGKDPNRSRLAVTEDSDDWGGTRAGLYAWALTRWGDVLAAAKPEVPELSNRAAELWAPLLALASLIETKRPGLLKELTTYAAKTVAPVVPQIVLSEQEKFLVTALTRLSASGPSAEISTTDILNAMRTIDPAAPLPSTQALGFTLERLRLFRSRRHTAAGRRFTIDQTRLAELAGAA